MQILIPIYHHFNTFDVNGPVEVLSQGNRVPKTQNFKITIAAAEELTTSVELVRMARDISIADAINRITEWDVLLVPGGVANVIEEMIGSWNDAKAGHDDTVHGVMKLIDTYMSNDSTRLTFTVCTGSLFLGALGRLAGRTATTHWGSISKLKDICESLPGGE